MNYKNVYIIPHIPKTGGSTIVNHLLELDESKYDFFHLAPRGRIGYHGNKRCFEFDIGTHKSDKAIIIMGHHVDEGLINYFPESNINLKTILRDPLERHISHYNMIWSSKNTDKGVNQFIKSRNNFMCKFLIKKFPSFIHNYLDSVPVQTNSILNKFSECFFLEDGADFFNKFLSVFDQEFDAKLTNTRREKNYKKQASIEDVNPRNIAFLNSDYSMYSKQRLRKSLAVEPLPQIESEHLWYKHYYSNLTQWVDNLDSVINTIPNSFLKTSLIAFQSSKQTDINKICKIALQHNEEFLTKENFINFLDLIEFLIKKATTYKIDNCNPNPKTDLAIIINVIANENPSSIKALKNKAILNIKFKTAELEMACAKIYLSEKKLEAAKKSILRSIKVAPLNSEAFYILHKLSLKENNKSTARRALEKCLELHPNNNKFKESYLKIFNYM